MERHWKRILPRLALLSLLGAVVLAAVLLKTPCLFRRATGLLCPSCGMTRAWLACLRLEFGTALSYHPMFWSLPVLALTYVLDGLPIPGKKVASVIYITTLLGFGVTWLIRTLFLLCGIITV